MYRNSVFSCVHTHHACITAIFTPQMKFLCSKTCLQGLYYTSHNLLFELPKFATFIAHKKQTAKMSIAIQACNMHVYQSYSVSLCSCFGAKTLHNINNLGLCISRVHVYNILFPYGLILPWHEKICIRA